jgi:hypothetical protein
MKKKQMNVKVIVGLIVEKKIIANDKKKKKKAI